jgi:hypothetical protein
VFNNRGQIFEKEQMKMFMYAIVIIFVSLIIVVSFSQSVNREVNVEEFVEQIIVYRLFSSPDCFSDGSGVVDLGKFYNENLEKCLSLPADTKAGVEMILFDMDGNQIAMSEINPSMVAQKITCGMSSSKVDCYNTRKYILYNDGSDDKSGILDMVVIANFK